MTVRLYVEPEALVPGNLRLRGDEHRYLRNVRRLGVGDQVELFDGSGQVALARLLRVDKSESELAVEEPRVVPPHPFVLTVAPALIKGERMDLAIGKLVELGVGVLRPMICEHTVVRLDDARKASRLARFEALAVAAGRQSRNLRLPRIEPIEDFAAVLAACADADLCLIPTTQPGAIPLAQALPAGPVGSCAVLIGPEGGFSRDEVDAASAAGFVPVVLGPRILRAETASLSLAAIVSFHYGDTGSR